MESPPSSYDSDTSDVQVSLRQRYPKRNKGWLARYRDKVQNLGLYVIEKFWELKPWQRVLACILVLVLFASAIVLLIFHQPILSKMEEWARRWRGVKGGWILLWLITCLTSFPPFMGYSYTLTMTGFIYGFPNGWFISSTATVLGSAFAFAVCRRSLTGFIQRLTKNDKRFELFSKVLHDGDFKLLCLIRFCPLPFSLSNGALAALTKISLRNFVLATIVITPKLLTHTFIGSQIAAIGEGGEESSRSKAIHYISIGLTLVVGIATARYVYNKAKAEAIKIRNAEAELDDELEAQPESPYSDGDQDSPLAKTPSNTQRRSSLGLTR